MILLFFSLLLSYPQPIITIDDGPNYKRTPRYLKLLKKHNRKATWFVLGVMLHDKRNQKWLREIVKQGHTLGNHLYSHRSPCRVTYYRGRRIKPLGVNGTIYELKLTEKLINKALGYRYPLKTWRAPHGHYCRNVYRAVAVRGYRHVGWHAGDLYRSANYMIRTIKRRAPKKTILMFHHRIDKLTKVLNFVQP